MEFSHVPVLLRESVAALHVRPDGVYVDGTAGGAGHSLEIAKLLGSGRLIALDRDPEAVEAAARRLAPYPQAQVIQSNFSEFGAVLARLGLRGADGVLLDLGVSSHQLDTARRGFSYHADAPLDMRMSKQGETAGELIARLSVEELTRILREYGEEKYAYQIAKAIAARRETAPIETTAQLAELVKDAVPAGARRDGHPARRTFQAIRIAVNRELESLTAFLDAAPDFLNSGGVVAVITFHSLEDRLVKRRFQTWCTGCTCPPDFPVCVCGKKPLAEPVIRGSLAPDAAQTAENPRARSARLRAVRFL